MQFLSLGYRGQTYVYRRGSAESSQIRVLIHYTMSEPNLPQEPYKVDQILGMMLDQLAALAWQRMGLQPDMITGKIHKDMGECKMAIDAFVALVPILERSLDAEDKQQLQNLVTTLQMNFVSHSSS